MPEPLDAELNLSFDTALSGVENLGRELDGALSSAVTSFEDDITKAIASIPVAEVDVQAVGVENITGEIDTAVGAADTTIGVEADVTHAETEVAALADQIDATQASIQVDADTSEAEASVNDLADAADTTTASVAGIGRSARSSSGELGLLTGATALARGEMGGLREAAGAINVPGVAAIAAVGLSIHHLFQDGVEATSAMQRFHSIIGESAQAVDAVHVGNLNTDLGKLATQLGTNDAQLHNASATLFSFARISNASREEAVRFTNQIDALAARAVALNPALGSVASVAQTMEIRLARGGRFAASFNLALTAAEITARALADTGKKTAAELTIYEKSAAAAAIATERYGSSLNETVAKGAENAAIKQKRLHEEIHQLLEEAGKKIVVPAFDLFEAGIPVVKAAATEIGALALAIEPLAKVLKFIEPLLAPIVQSVIAFELASRLAVPALNAMATGFVKLGIAAEGVGLSRTTNLMQNFGLGIEKVGTALPLVAVGGALAATSFKDMGKTAGASIQGIAGFATAGAGIGTAFGNPLLGAGIGAAAGGIVTLTKAVLSSTPAIEKFREQVDGLAKELEVADQRGAAKKFVDSLGDTEKAALGIDHLSGSVVIAAKHFQTAKNGVVDFGKPMVETVPKIAAVTKEIEVLALKSPAAARRVVDAFTQLRTETGKPFFNEAQLQRLTSVIDDQVNKLDRRIDRQRESDRINASVTGTTYAVGVAVETETQKLVDNTQAVKDANDAKQKQIDTLTEYLDILHAQEDKEFAATKAMRDAQKADQDLIDANKDDTKSLLDKKVALDDDIVAHRNAAIAESDAKFVTDDAADANVNAKNKADLLVQSLEYQKSQVEQGGPVWNALNDYQQKITRTPEYIATTLAITIQADLQETEAYARGIGNLEEAFGIFVPSHAAKGKIIPARPGGTMVNVGEAGSTEVIVPTDDRARAVELLTEAGLGDLLGGANTPSGTTVTAPVGGHTTSTTTVTNIDRSINAPISVYEAVEPRATAAALVRRFSDYQYLQGG